MGASESKPSPLVGRIPSNGGSGNNNDDESSSDHHPNVSSFRRHSRRCRKSSTTSQQQDNHHDHLQKMSSFQSETSYETMTSVSSGISNNNNNHNSQQSFQPPSSVATSGPSAASAAASSKKHARDDDDDDIDMDNDTDMEEKIDGLNTENANDTEELADDDDLHNGFPQGVREKFKVNDRVYASNRGWYWSWGHIKAVHSYSDENNEANTYDDDDDHDHDEPSYDLDLLDGLTLDNVPEHCIISLNEAIRRMTDSVRQTLPRDMPPVHFTFEDIEDIMSVKDKERTFKRGSRVYAEFIRQGFFWATIVDIIHPRSNDRSTRKLYKLRFDDGSGDKSEQDATMIHSVEEAIRLMDLGLYPDDPLPEEWNFRRPRKPALMPSNVPDTRTSSGTARNNNTERSSGTKNHRPMQANDKPKKRQPNKPKKHQPNKKRRTEVVFDDVVFDDEVFDVRKIEQNVRWIDENLESIQVKESYFDRGQVVYGEWPEEPCKGQFYWGVIHSKFEAKGRLHYTVKFEDGTQATLLPEKMHSYKEAMELMKRKDIGTLLPSKEWMESVKKTYQ